jgi:multiple sugar transport system substrate-binding protein
MTYMVDIGGPYQKVAKKWADDFTAAHPGTTVEYQPVVDHYSDKLLAAFAGGTPPDVFRYLQEIIPIDAAVQRHLLLPLTSYIDRDKYDLSDFMPTALDLYRWGGKLYALPRDYGAQFVFYNADLFQKAGLQPPPATWSDTSWTFSKFLEAAEKLTIKSGSSTSQWGCLVNTGWRPWATFVYSNGASVVQKNANGEATAITLTDAPAVEGLQFLQDLMFKYQVAPRPTVQQGLGGSQLFLSGKVGMVIDNPGAVANDRAIKDFTWDVAAVPVGDHATKRGTGGGGTGWAAAAAGKHLDQGWQFIQYISSQQAEYDEVAIGGTTPSRTTVVNSTQFLSPTLPPKDAKTFPDGQGYVVRDPLNPNWPQISQQVLTQQMATLFNGSKPAKDVAAAIKQQADPQLQQGLQATS